MSLSNFIVGAVKNAIGKVVKNVVGIIGKSYIRKGCAKKGGLDITLTATVFIILFLFAAGALLLFTSRVQNDMCGGEVQACRTAVKSAHLLSKVGIDVPASCPGKTVAFKREKPEEINKLITQELEKCIFKFHEGKLDFSEGGNFFANVYKGQIDDEVICFRCATFDFSDYKKKEDYKEYSASDGTLFDYQKERGTICARPQVKVADYIGGLRDGLSNGEGQIFVNDVRSVEPDGKYILFMSTWKRGAFEQLIGVAATVSYYYSRIAQVASLSKPDPFSKIAYFFIATKMAAYYEERGEYIPVSMSVQLLPIDSPELGACTLFYQ